MKKTSLWMLAVATLLTSACTSQQAEIDALRSENDSLRQAKTQMETEINGYFESVNAIQQNLDKMKQMESVIDITPIEGEGSDAIGKINRDINHLSQLLQKNKRELNDLKQRLDKSNLNIKQLKQTIASLNQQLDTQAKNIENLKRELENKNQLIALMSDTIESQNQQIDDLTTRADEQAQTIASHEQTIDRHEQTISTAWYVFGTRKELKAQNIVSGKSVLQGDFNKDYFVRIDTRRVNSIPLYSSRAKILTTHPAASYRLEKEDGNLVLHINDTEQFWSISKYLVIEVD